MEDGISTDGIIGKAGAKITIPPPPDIPRVEAIEGNMQINDPIGLLERYGSQLGLHPKRVTGSHGSN